MHDAEDDEYELGEPPEEYQEFEPVHDDDVPTDSDDADEGGTQHMLLSYLRANKEIWVRCAPILKGDYFDPSFASVLDAIFTFEKETNLLPSKELIRADTGVELDIPEDYSEPPVVDAICNRVEEFCRHQAMVTFLIESAEIVGEDRSRATLSAMASVMDDIASISVQQDLGYEIYSDMDELLTLAKKQDALPTGYHLLDMALNGGVTNPSLNLVSAASGQGKSIYLQNQAFNYSQMGFNVIYVSLELPEFMLAKRFGAIMTGVAIQEIYDRRDEVLSSIKRQAKVNGSIQVQRMKMSGTTVADIKATTNALTSSTGKKWQHIMVDYMDLLAPGDRGLRSDNIHGKDQAVSVELYDWAHERGSNKVIWTASQQTKGAMEEKGGRQSAVSGGVGKVHTCDNLIIFKRTTEDIANEHTIAYIEKGRNGGQGIKVPFHWDGQSQRMTTPHEYDNFYTEINTPDEDTDKSVASKARGRLQNDPVFKASSQSDSQGASPPTGPIQGKKVGDRMGALRNRLAAGAKARMK